jgi:hypothetical protein
MKKSRIAVLIFLSAELLVSACAAKPAAGNGSTAQMTAEETVPEKTIPAETVPEKTAAESGTAVTGEAEQKTAAAEKEETEQTKPAAETKPAETAAGHTEKSTSAPVNGAYAAGQALAEKLIEKTGVKSDSAQGLVRMELFSGDPQDKTAAQRFGGEWKTLEPFIKKGIIVIPSGQNTFEKVSSGSTDTDTARIRMLNILGAYYPKRKVLDAVLCDDETTAEGAEQAIEEAYWDQDRKPVVIH